MDSYLSNGAYLVLSNCAAASLQRELDRWFEQVHLPDMVSTGLVARPTLYRNVVPEEEPHILTIYEVTRADALPTVHGEVMLRFWPGWQAAGRIHPALQIVGHQLWRRLRPDSISPKTGRAPTTGLLATESICTDPARDPEFQTWYDEVHVPDILGTGLYHTVSRFEATSPEAGKGRYLALYQTDAPDPTAPADELKEKWRALWAAQGRRSSLIRVTARHVYRKL